MLIWLSIGAFAQTWKLLHATMLLRFRVAHGEVVADFWPLTLLTWSQSQCKQKANSPLIDLVLGKPHGNWPTATNTIPKLYLNVDRTLS